MLDPHSPLSSAGTGPVAGQSGQWRLLGWGARGQEDPGSLTPVGLARVDGQPQRQRGDGEAGRSDRWWGFGLWPVGAASRAPEAAARAGLDLSSGAQRQKDGALSG